jgi:glycosyltransferase involved in cell wall biosynthesis
MRKGPFFSIVIPVTDQTVYKIPFTLDSLISQVFRDYEIVIIDGQKQEHSLHFFDAYKEHISRIEPALGKSLWEMMNQGLSYARGAYLHFLKPGEFYLTRYALEILAGFIAHEGHPDLLYSGWMVRHSLSSPQMVFKKLHLEDLKGGRIPSSMEFFWLKRETLLDKEGFDCRYELQSGVDLICRIFLDRHLKKVFMKRILTDYDYKRVPPKKVVQQFWESLRIITRHFGISKALFWWLAQNPFYLIQWWLRTLKAAFLRKH